MKRLGIIGSGAMAQFFAARLSETAQVVLAGTYPLHMEAIAGGITCIHQDGKETKHKITSGTNPAALPPCQHIIILTKSHQTEEAARRAKALLDLRASDSCILTLQNGMGNLETIQAINGKDKVLAGVTTQAAKLEAPGTVRDTGAGSIFLPGAEQDDKATVFASLFGNAGFDVQTEESIDAALWKKLLINAAINPITAIYRKPNGFIASDSKARKEAEAIIEEFIAIADKAGHLFDKEEAVTLVMQVANATATNQSSMLSDVKEGRKTEIDAILGYLLAKADEQAQASPVIRYFYQRIKAIEPGFNAI